MKKQIQKIPAEFLLYKILNEVIKLEEKSNEQNLHIANLENKDD